MNSSKALIAGAALVAGAAAATYVVSHMYQESGKNHLPRAVLVTDPVSTGANLIHTFLEKGVPVISVFSRPVPDSLLEFTLPGLRTDVSGTIEMKNGNLDEVVEEIKTKYYPKFDIFAVVAGSELGVELCDELSVRLSLPGNGNELTDCRRDKYLMNEKIRAAGIPAVKQARVTQWSDVERFLEREYTSSSGERLPFKLVIKPARSGGSDHVYICSDLEELRSKFETIVGQINQLGLLNDAAVLQEYLEGVEYVVDSVSRNGEHRIVCLWDYDKRFCNGHNFVYFGMGIIDGASEVGKQLCEYIFPVLDALGFREGAGHGEVIITPRGPVLVEIGSRAHGAEGTFMPVADASLGYNQVGAMVAATLNDEDWARIPRIPTNLKKYSFKVDFVSFVEGKLEALDHISEIEALPSFMRFDCMPKIGQNIPKTIDCFTAVGSVSLAHESKEQVERDHALIREWEKSMFIVS